MKAIIAHLTRRGVAMDQPQEEDGLQAQIRASIDEIIVDLGHTLQDIVVQHCLQGQSIASIASGMRLREDEVSSLVDLALFSIEGRLHERGISATRADVEAALRVKPDLPGTLVKRLLGKPRRSAPRNLSQLIERMEDICHDLAVPRHDPIGQGK